ncbi:phosphotransferase enzyme family protein [Ceratobasidium sp. AG-Ba]|nr:phosphotransferase enzyme family protein [Ceratobasidium sp. AG-Ba]
MDSAGIISVTKTRLEDAKIQEIITHLYGSAPEQLEIQEFTNGCYNAAYLITTEHGPCVLKVAPKPSIRVLRYERNILDAEVRVLNILSRLQAPLRTPKVLIFDQSCSIVEAPYAIIEYIPGEPLDKHRGTLPESEIITIDKACGRHLRFAHDITRINSGDDRPDGPISEFGLCAIDAPRFSTWREAFSDLFLSVLADGEEAGVEGVPYEDIRAALSAYAGVFDEVTEPRLVIWDMWDGNILISFSEPSTKTGASISGTIDYERALWGDPLMETTFRSVQGASPALLEAYGAKELTSTERLRRLFYDLHFSLVILIEVTYRGLKDLEKGGKDMEMWGRMGVQMCMQALQTLGSK